MADNRPIPIIGASLLSHTGIIICGESRESLMLVALLVANLLQLISLTCLALEDHELYTGASSHSVDMKNICDELNSSVSVFAERCMCNLCLQ